MVGEEQALTALSAGRPALVWRTIVADTETPVGAALTATGGGAVAPSLPKESSSNQPPKLPGPASVGWPSLRCIFATERIWAQQGWMQAAS